MISGVANKVKATGPMPRGWSFQMRYILSPLSKIVIQKANQCESSTEAELAVLPTITFSSTGQDHMPNIAGT